MSATLVLRNQDKVAIVIQADARHWRQQDGEDLLTPTRELLVTPPIVTIAPGAEQVLRVALRRPLDPRQEMNYRIFLQEIAPPPQPGFRGVQVALRISLPVFAKAGEGVQSKPIWSARYLAQEHALRLVLENAGAAHLQLQDFALTQKQPQNQNQPQSPQTLASRQSPRYLLAGQRQEWVIALDPAVRLSGQKNLPLTKPLLLALSVCWVGGLHGPLEAQPLAAARADMPAAAPVTAPATSSAASTSS
eukprot:gene28967-50872_t